MGMIVRIKNIVSPNPFKISIKSATTPYSIDSGFTDYAGTFSGRTNLEDSNEFIYITGYTFSPNTRYWIKLTDTVTNRYIIENIFINDLIGYNDYIIPTPTPTPTPSATSILITPTPSATPGLSPTPTPSPTLTPFITPCYSFTLSNLGAEDVYFSVTDCYGSVYTVKIEGQIGPSVTIDCARSVTKIPGSGSKWYISNDGPCV